MFCQILRRNVNISNEFKFSDVYRIINYIGSLAKFPRDIDYVTFVIWVLVLAALSLP